MTYSLFTDQLIPSLCPYWPQKLVMETFLPLTTKHLQSIIKQHSIPILEIAPADESSEKNFHSLVKLLAERNQSALITLKRKDRPQEQGILLCPFATNQPDMRHVRMLAFLFIKTPITVLKQVLPSPTPQSTPAPPAQPARKRSSSSISSQASQRQKTDTIQVLPNPVSSVNIPSTQLSPLLFNPALLLNGLGFQVPSNNSNANLMAQLAVVQALMAQQSPIQAPLLSPQNASFFFTNSQ